MVWTKSGETINHTLQGIGLVTRRWLVGWVLWHINLCRLFNAKSIFMQIVLFQKIQFSKSLIVKNISISTYSFYSNCFNSANSV